MSLLCLNLRELFGDRFKINFDPTYDPCRVPRDKLDPWMMQLACRCGTIYPFGGDLLAVEVDHHPNAAKALRCLPNVTPHQEGDREQSFLFPLGLFDRVAEVVQPRKRRRLTEEQRAAAAGRLSAHSFKANPQANTLFEA